VFRTFLGTNRINVDIHGFDPVGPPGNLNAVRHFDMPNLLRQEVINARIWAGLHYHFSCVAVVVLAVTWRHTTSGMPFDPSSSPTSSRSNDAERPGAQLAFDV